MCRSTCVSVWAYVSVCMCECVQACVCIFFPPSLVPVASLLRAHCLLPPSDVTVPTWSLSSHWPHRGAWFLIPLTEVIAESERGQRPQAVHPTGTQSALREKSGQPERRCGAATVTQPKGSNPDETRGADQPGNKVAFSILEIANATSVLLMQTAGWNAFPYLDATPVCDTCLQSSSTAQVEWYVVCLVFPMCLCVTFLS